MINVSRFARAPLWFTLLANTRALSLSLPVLYLAGDDEEAGGDEQSQQQQQTQSTAEENGDSNSTIGSNSANSS